MMALPAFANEGFVEKGHFAPVSALRAPRGAQPREQLPSSYQQQADRLLDNLDRRPLPRRRHTPKLPLMARIGIVGFGAVLGWAVPIAVATTLVH